MTITYAHVQSATGEANPATAALTVTEGNLLVVHALERSGTTEANFTISDGAGNTWTKRVGRDIVLGDSSNRRTWVVWTAVANGSGSTTVSVDNGTANVIRILFTEIEPGAAVTWAFEAAASNDNGGTDEAITIATGTTASVGAGALLLIGGFGLKKSSGGATSIHTDWASSNLTSVADSGPPGANGRYIAVGALQESGAGTKASTATVDADNESNEGICASILVFSATEGGGTVTGTGAISLGTLAVAGTAEREVTDIGGAVELLLAAITVSGEGTAGGDLVTGTGAVALGAVTVSGTAERQIAGAGAITLGAVAVSGTAERQIPGSAAITLGALTVAGSGTRGQDATGAINLAALTVSGTAERQIAGSGALTLGPLAVSGLGAIEGEVTGAGAVALGALTVSGTAERSISGSGAITLGALAASGIGALSGEVTGTGAVTLGAIEVAAQGLLEIIGTGAITLGAIALSSANTEPTSFQTATVRGPGAATVTVYG